MRVLGFNGSRGTFSLPSNTHWIRIGFQSSRWNDKERVRFTVNVTAVSKADWDAVRRERSYLPEQPAANTFYGRFAWQSRIGRLLPAGTDRWWEVRPGSNLDHVAADVIAAITEGAMPAIELHGGITRPGSAVEGNRNLC
jgi:hypothetical protein